MSDKPTATVNNAITDLLDEVIRQYLTCLILEGGKPPIVIQGGKPRNFNDAIMDHEEIADELEALGISPKVSIMQHYTHENEENEFFKVFVTVDEKDKHVSFYISRLTP